MVRYRPPVQSVLRPLPHLVAYGSTNKYRPVNRSKASGSSAKRPIQAVYFPRITATPLTMTPTVKAMDSQRWVCRTHLFQFNGTSSRLHGALFCDLLNSRLLSRPRRPVGRFNTELLGVLRVQPLPAAKLHRLTTNDGADRCSAEKAIQNIETNVPARGAPRDEAAIDAVPQRQTRAATKGFEFPPDITVLQHPRSVGSRHCCFERRGISHPGEIHRGPNRTQVPIHYEGSPLAQMRRLS